MLPSFAYVRPRSVDEAVKHLREAGSRLHAGGTDLLGCLHDRVFAADKVVRSRGFEDDLEKRLDAAAVPSRPAS